jgi:methionyl-tRNA formyltransferase
MTIYHFANETFGKYFITVFENLRNKFPDQKFVLVISTITYTTTEKLFRSKIRAKVKRSLGEDINSIYDRILLCKSVNTKSFATSISNTDVGFISGFNQIFKPEIINRFGTLLNIHPSILPYYRGPVPSYWVLLNREKYSGFTIHHIDEHIDRGIIVAQKKIKIGPEETVNSLDQKIAELSHPHCESVFESIINNIPIVNNTIDAQNIYENHIGYMSFPSK